MSFYSLIKPWFINLTELGFDAVKLVEVSLVLNF